jgi:hypothetical protein
VTALLRRVAIVVAAAREVYAEVPAADRELAAIERRFDEPLRLAIAGKVKAGKSTLLNALVGEPLAATDAAECTKVVTWYVEGTRYRATLEAGDGSVAEIPLLRRPAGTTLDLGGRAPEEIERVVVEWPSSRLHSLTLIDTPGVGSVSGLGQRTFEVLAPDDEQGTPADAVLYLTPHLHSSDVRFLEAFHDDASARATPVNALGVLSRADEIGGGRVDSLRSAARVAGRIARDPSVRRLCQTVLPVAGLLAEASTTLTESDLRVLGRLATLPHDELAMLSASAERLATTPLAKPDLEPARRRAVVDRFGIFGVRLAVDLLRQGQVETAPQLAAELRHRSGIESLERLLATRFAARADVLKARSALLALGDVLRRWPLEGRADGLRAQVEQVQAGAHELAELRVLVAARSGDVPLDDEALADLERVLSSGDPHERLGIEPGDDLLDAVVEAIGRWRSRAEHPLAAGAVVEASAVVVRTLEGLVAAHLDGSVR